MRQRIVGVITAVVTQINPTLRFVNRHEASRKYLFVIDVCLNELVFVYIMLHECVNYCFLLSIYMTLSLSI